MKLIISEEKINDLQRKVLNLIETQGFLDAVKLMGGYSTLRKIMVGVDYLTPERMIDVIRDIISQSEEGSLQPMDIGLNPVIINDTEEFLEQIEMFGYEGPYVVVYKNYKGYYDSDDESLIKWEELDPIHLYEIFDGMVDEWEEGGL